MLLQNGSECLRKIIGEYIKKVLTLITTMLILAATAFSAGNNAYDGKPGIPIDLETLENTDSVTVHSN